MAWSGFQLSWLIQEVGCTGYQCSHLIDTETQCWHWLSYYWLSYHWLPYWLSYWLSYSTLYAEKPESRTTDKMCRISKNEHILILNQHHSKDESLCCVFTDFSLKAWAVSTVALSTQAVLAVELYQTEKFLIWNQPSFPIHTKEMISHKDFALTSPDLLVSLCSTSY